MRRSARHGDTPKSPEAETSKESAASRRKTPSPDPTSAAADATSASSGASTSTPGKRASTPPAQPPPLPPPTPATPAGSSSKSTIPRGSGKRNRDLDVSRWYGIAAGLALLGVRVAGGLITPIADCDETYNYWEPLHYLLYGTGMQTWEYSPVYTLRSYAYLLPHAAIGKALAVVLHLLQGPVLPDKRLIFYSLRILLSLISAACEATFVDGIARRLGARPGFLTFLLLLTSAGLFQAAPALLPSSAATNLVMVTTANWLTRRYWWATFFAVAAVLALGWPFVALLFLPLALHVLHDCIYSSTSTSASAPGRSPQYQRGLTRVLGYGIGALLLLLPPVLVIDAYFYRRLAFPALNILLYNIGGGPEGADDKLYGIEPWSFYLKNLHLNLNISLPLALLFPLLLLLPFLPWPTWSTRTKIEALVFVSPAFLWLGVMTLRPHKEERFLFPIYPLLALCAALSLHGLTAALEAFALATGGGKERGKWGSSSNSSSSSSSNTPGKKRTASSSSSSAKQPPSSSSSSSLLLRLAQRLANLLAKALIPLTLLLHTLLSLSRAVSMTHNFSAPLHLFGDFSRLQRTSYLLQQQQAASSPPSLPPSRPTRLCLGAEWYRFPSSFFLPHDNVQLAFVRAGFGGQLPQPFRPENGTWAPPLQPFNEYNREETSRYVPIHSCQYLVELFPPPHTLQQQQQQQQQKGEEQESEDEQIVHNIKWVDTRLRELGEARPVAWKVLKHYPLLDKDLSPSPWRAFWVPFVSGPRLHYGAFTLLEREEEEDFDPGPAWAELGFMQ